VAEAMRTLPAPPEILRLAAPLSFEFPLAYFLPVKVEHDGWGTPWAHARPTNGSGDFISLTGTDGFVELPSGPASYPKGHLARLYRW
jgi:molybdopterin molybdotransferase